MSGMFLTDRAPWGGLRGVAPESRTKRPVFLEKDSETAPAVLLSSLEQGSVFNVTACN